MSLLPPIPATKTLEHLESGPVQRVGLKACKYQNAEELIDFLDSLQTLSNQLDYLQLMRAAAGHGNIKLFNWILLNKYSLVSNLDELRHASAMALIQGPENVRQVMLSQFQYLKEHGPPQWEQSFGNSLYRLFLITPVPEKTYSTLRLILYYLQRHQLSDGRKVFCNFLGGLLFNWACQEQNMRVAKILMEFYWVRPDTRTLLNRPIRSNFLDFVKYINERAPIDFMRYSDDITSKEMLLYSKLPTAHTWGFSTAPVVEYILEKNSHLRHGNSKCQARWDDMLDECLHGVVSPPLVKVLDKYGIKPSSKFFNKILYYSSPETDNIMIKCLKNIRNQKKLLITTRICLKEHGRLF